MLPKGRGDFFPLKIRGMVPCPGAASLLGPREAITRALA